MKTWHWIAIGGAALVAVWYLFMRGTNTQATIAGDKIGTSGSDAGAPPLPNIAMSNPTSAKPFTWPLSLSAGAPSTRVYQAPGGWKL